MARILETEEIPVESWQVTGEDSVAIVLDKNEAVAVRDAVRRYRVACNECTPSTSLNGAGGRVYEALHPLVEKNNWC